MSDNDKSFEDVMAEGCVIGVFLAVVAAVVFVYSSIVWIAKHPDESLQVAIFVVTGTLFLLWLPELMVAAVVLWLSRDVPMHTASAGWDDDGFRKAVLVWVGGVPVVLTLGIVVAAFSVQANVFIGAIYLVVTILTYYCLYFNVPTQQTLIPRAKGIAHIRYPEVIKTEETILLDVRLKFLELGTKAKLWWRSRVLQWQKMNEARKARSLPPEAES